jgi:deoxyribonuclease-1-like protein
MRRFVLLVLLVGGCFGGWYLSSNYTIERHYGPDGKFQYMSVGVRAPSAAPASTSGSSALPPAAPPRPAMRIASFNTGGLDEIKLANPRVSDALVRVIPRFDIVALQAVRSKDRAVLVRLVEQINATGRVYGFAVCPTLQQAPAEQYNALVFDLTTVEVDGSTVHSVEDPAKRFRTKPLVASFRVRGVPEAEAFTFTLVNVLVDAQRSAQEVDLLGDVFRAVREHESQRNEDDVIMVGDLEADPEHLGRLAHVSNLVAAVSGLPSTTRGTHLADNILFDRRATVEYTGRSGVVDLIRELDLTPQATLEISEHLPVWAEFSSYEGGQGGHVP